MSNQLSPANEAAIGERAPGNDSFVRLAQGTIIIIMMLVSSPAQVCNGAIVLSHAGNSRCPIHGTHCLYTRRASSLKCNAKGSQLRQQMNLSFTRRPNTRTRCHRLFPMQNSLLSGSWISLCRVGVAAYSRHTRRQFIENSRRILCCLIAPGWRATQSEYAFEN